jgi:hypothetical protein
LAARGERKGRWEWAGGALWAKRGGVGPHGPKGEGGRGLLGWAERRGRERGFGKELSSFFSNSFFKLSKVLNSFKTFHLLNSFPKISNQFKDS